MNKLKIEETRQERNRKNYNTVIVVWTYGDSDTFLKVRFYI